MACTHSFTPKNHFLFCVRLWYLERAWYELLHHGNNEIQEQKLNTVSVKKSDLLLNIISIEIFAHRNGWLKKQMPLRYFIPLHKIKFYQITVQCISIALFSHLIQ